MKLNKELLPQHIAIILDGNGRWAKRRGLPRNIGHYRGAMNLIDIANEAHKLGIDMMTVYAFSTENWKRPQAEVDYLMQKPVEMLNQNLDKIAESPLKVKVIGRKDRFDQDLLKTISSLEKLTEDHTGMTLNICFDYGGYDEIITAAKHDIKDQKDFEKHLMLKDPVDLLIRTGGELRLSNFLLWQAAYAEFYFTKTFWPAFNKRKFHKALNDYAKRNRRFGGLKT